MSIPMPNVIDLPYGKYPPLHFQAPTWRDLLRLLARLSNCRFQASVESMALAKTELKLRTVIQFVRPHHAFPEWRTIVWFTLDYPEPQTKWAPRHPTLPYSYSLSTIPTLLRDVESEMSKVFTVPETNMPFPKLPISFPDLALYLQATLDESRRQSNDSYNGKLAKMVATCFPVQPSDTSSTDPLGSSSRMSRMIKWPWGKGKPGKKGTSSNEETYYLVTPFVAGEHEWG
ncbi:hypothetical protein BDN72DRAFT_756531 [Pluteus cervinus]|uniref:Uncharacterized protein n=1 Tax=Pluteus cervinus TaxID=181527 RepID=A0ACD3BCW3_9AGAR|nr:hypothetical protein BDN72DRAFT_756531 [Pluteus cervinus]